MCVSDPSLTLTLFPPPVCLSIHYGSLSHLLQIILLLYARHFLGHSFATTVHDVDE